MRSPGCHIKNLRAAEGQFRLATAVRLAASFKSQPLDLPLQWSHGRHTVKYSEIAISQDDADFAAWNLQRSATFLMASAALEGIRAVITDPKRNTDAAVASAYQIARLIRNAFAHSPFAPIWRIDPDCQTQRFEVPGIITLDCTDLDGKSFDWRHYGGPLAILSLSQFVRHTVLADTVGEEKVIPLPKDAYIQQGDLVLKSTDEISPGAVPVTADPFPDGRISLGGGHDILPREMDS